MYHEVVYCCVKFGRVLSSIYLSKMVGYSYSRKLNILNVSSMFGWGCPGSLYFSKLISNTIGSHYLKSCIFVISKRDLKHHQVIFNCILIIFSYINIKWLIVFLYFDWILVWLSMMTKAFSRKFNLKFTFFNLIVVIFIFFLN